ncbi:PREDICTED: DELLA protein RGL3-like [Erythranthe guttata]|nr:PREDICTED: DELLA protein RGL3-like [Erythranthe guttata]|eukprot:XP_012846595.1 PREDICTED: DELLA protein RGL3-like [Erythranthe guttata]
MLNNIFQTEQFSTSVASDEYNLEKLAKESGFYEGDQEWGGSESIDMDFFTCGTSLFAQSTPHTSSCGDEFKKIIEPGKTGFDRFHSSSSSSFEILNKYGSRCRRFNGENKNLQKYGTEANEPSTFRLSIEQIIRVASENFIEYSTSQISNEVSILSHPYPSSILCHSKEDSQAVELVQNLLLCAEKVNAKQYERAKKILLECDRMSSPKGTPIQRLVFYFTEALYEKIDGETGNITRKGLSKKTEDPLEALKSSEETMIAFHKEVPLSQITKFAGIQSVVDNIGDAKKIHFIIFEIRKGIQCTILMQALSENCVEHLKITSVGTKTSRASMEKTGTQLTSFSNSLGFRFSFNVVIVDDISDLDKSQFKIEENEAIIVYAEFALTNMIGQSDRLEHLMKLIKALNPCVMVVTEVEANCNSPIFVDRFVEALFFYGASFELMGDCMKNDEKHRFIAEGTCFGSSIRNIIATEGGERKIRHVSVSVWRAFFERFGFEEIELSDSSIYQANLVLKNFAFGDSFTFNFDGKSLIIGWKGTPISSLSAWKLKCTT